jgi:hypothetical protein
LLTRLAAAPIAVGDRRFTFSDLDSLTETFLAEGNWNELSTTLSDLEQGNATRPLALADLDSRRNRDGGYSAASGSANLLIHCADQFGPPGVSEAEYRAGVASLVTGFPRFSTRGLAAIGCFRRTWPQPSFAVTPTLAPPLFVVGSRRDPRTLYELAEQMTAALGNASYLLDSPHEGHVAYFSSDLSKRRIIDSLITPTEMPDEWSCRNQPLAGQLTPSSVTHRVTVALQPTPSAAIPVTVQVVEAERGRVVQEQMVQSGSVATFTLPTQGRALDVAFRASASG